MHCVFLSDIILNITYIYIYYCVFFKDICVLVSYVFLSHSTLYTKMLDCQLFEGFKQGTSRITYLALLLIFMFCSHTLVCFPLFVHCSMGFMPFVVIFCCVLLLIIIKFFCIHQSSLLCSEKRQCIQILTHFSSIIATANMS